MNQDHGIILTISDMTPEELEPKRSELADVLQDQTGLVIEIDKLLPAMSKFPNGTCCRVGSTGTDVYFHAVDPSTNEILGYGEEKVQRYVI